jgi:hypothetical protein
MSRKVGLEKGYKAVHIRTTYGGELDTVEEGVYSAPHTAKARLTFWSNYLGENYVNGWLEESDLVWTRVD